MSALQPNPPKNPGENPGKSGGETYLLRLRLGLGIPHFGDRLAVLLVELLLGPEEPGHEEVEDGPELEHVVLDWGPGQQHPVLALHALDRERDLGPRVLDDVALTTGG